MHRILFAIICLIFAPLCFCQAVGTGVSAGTAPTSGVFTFEGGPAGMVPAGWGGGPLGTVMVDDQIVHDGLRSVRLERKKGSQGNYSSLSKTLPMVFPGKKIELRGFLRTENVSGSAAIWMREVNRGYSVEFNSMNGHSLSGTTDWKEYSINLRVSSAADQLFIGTLLNGTGKVWVSGLRLYLDDKLFLLPPGVEPPTTVSGDQVASLSAKPVTVKELEEALDAVLRWPDSEVAQRLSGLRLTERMSSAELSSWKAKLPGQKSSEALVVLADESAFLDPPASEIPATSAPDITEKRRMIGLALDYLDKVVPQLPNFIATRSTERYDQSPPKAVLTVSPNIGGVQPWHAAGKFSANVLYRDGKEVVNSEAVEARKPNEEGQGLVTRGVFGPILSTVVGDAARSGMIWSRWEQGATGPQAVFRYAVPKAGSHYEVAYKGLPGKDEGNSLQQNSGYHGEIAIDPASGAILRLTLVADLEPRQSILKGDIMVEYGPVEIGEKTYTCPQRSVSISKVLTTTVLRALRGSDRTILSYETMLNDVVFKDYHVFRTEMRLQPADDPAPK